MMMRLIRLLQLFILAGVIAACSDSKDKADADPNIMPSRYRQEVVDTLRDQIFNKNETTSVTNALISDPALRPVGGEQRYTICVRYTAHSVVAGLTANAERIGYFYGGHLNQLVETTGNECRDAAYKPFPELNQVCIGKACK
jgi:hypothetical protein